MTQTNCSEVLKRWLAAINAHDVSAVATLMAEDHVFVDSLGNRVQGAKPDRREVIVVRQPPSPLARRAGETADVSYRFQYTPVASIPTCVT